MDLRQRISEALERELARIYDDEGITTGDITPEQLLQWENIAAAAAELFTALIEQNEKNGVLLPF